MPELETNSSGTTEGHTGTGAGEAGKGQPYYVLILCTETVY